jgi:Transposase IS116/IS110/IS902 family
VYRRLLKMVLEELQFFEQPIVQLEQEMANLLSQHQEAVQRLARCPVWEWLRHGRSLPKWGARAAAFDSQKHSSSWVGACPGDDESAGVSTSHRSPKGNRQMRRILKSMRQRCGQDERKHLRDRVSSPRTMPGTQSDHWGNYQSHLSADLDNLAPRGLLRGTRPGRLRKGAANTHCENDPAAPKPRLPHGTVDCSSHPRMRPRVVGGGVFDPARNSGIELFEALFVFRAYSY